MYNKASYFVFLTCIHVYLCVCVLMSAGALGDQKSLAYTLEQLVAGNQS